MTPQANVLALSMDAIAFNAEQDRLLHDPSEDVDSISEHAARLLRLTQGEARAHVAEIVKLAAKIRTSNQAEHDCARQIAHSADSLGIREPWSIKRLAPALRPILADLGNPVIGDTRRRARARELQAIVADAPRANLTAASLRNEIGLRKFDLLQRLIGAIV